MIHRRLALVLALALAAVPCVTAAQTSGQQPAGPSVNAQPFMGMGALAFVQNDVLFTLDGATGAVTAISGADEDAIYPRWSADGAWLAYTDVSPDLRRYGGAEGALHIASADGAQNRIVDDLPAAVLGAGVRWSPQADVLAVMVAGTEQCPAGLWLVPAEGPSQLLVGSDAGNVSDAYWSPDGSQLAYATRGDLPPAPTVDGLWTVPAEGGDAVLRFANDPAAGSGLLLFGWTADGAHLLFGQDPAHSASLAADGVQMFSLPLDGSGPVPLATALTYPDWRAPSPDGATLALVVGSGRTASRDKTVALCDVNAGGCATLPLPAGMVSLAPAWSPDGGHLAYVQAAAHAEGFNGDAERNGWLDSHQLVVADAHGDRATPLTPAGQPAFAPEWATDGQTLLYVCGEQGGVCLVNASGDATSQQVLDGLGDADVMRGPSDYYGHVDWSRYLDWRQ